MTYQEDYEDMSAEELAKHLPQEIVKIDDLIMYCMYYQKLLGWDAQLTAVYYDSGYGSSGFSPSSFTVENGKLRIEI